MQFENTKVYNFEGAFRGLRNPMNSWNKSDSYFGLTDIYNTDSLTDVIDSWIQYENIGRSERNLEPYGLDMVNSNEYYDKCDEYNEWLAIQGILASHDDICEVAFLGPNDLHLAQRLILAGSEHAKFTRQIFISVDITAPIYFFKEFDTYKVGTTANSTSTMHKLTSAPITREMFEWDKGDDLIIASGTAPHSDGWEFTFDDYIEDVVDICEKLRQKYLETNDKRYWRALIQYLPQSFLQTRTWTADYAVLRNIYKQRRSHRLKEWHEFCNWIKTLPYAEDLIILEDTDETY